MGPLLSPLDELRPDIVRCLGSVLGTSGSALSPASCVGNKMDLAVE